MFFKKKVSPVLIGIRTLDVMDEDNYTITDICPKEFTLTSTNTKYPTIKFYNCIDDHVRYLNNYEHAEDYIRLWILNELKVYSEITNSILDFLTVHANISNIHMSHETLDHLLTQAESMTIVRLKNLDMILRCTLEPEFIETIRSRYVWDLYKYMKDTSTLTPENIDSLYIFTENHSWFYMLPIIKSMKLRDLI